MIELTTPRPGESWFEAIRRQERENASSDVTGRAILEAADLQAAVICADPMRRGLVFWDFAKVAALREGLVQAEIRLRFEQRKAKKAESARGPYILML